MPANIPPSIRERMLSDYQARLENMKNNQDYRNAMLERRIASSSRENDDDEDSTSTRPVRGMPLRPGMDRFGSTTMPGRGLGIRMMEERKRFATHQFEIALNNLSNIRGRLDSRITKEQGAGRDMSKAIALLAVADAKISVASTSVAALDAFALNASTTVTATTTIDRDAARELADAAKKAIKDAQKALNDVVVAIAHAMGLKLGLDGHATTTATTTVTVTTSTSTSSTTSQ
jgi:hypothetical protein